MAQEIFERCEKKYLLPKEAYLKLVPELVKHMEADAYGKYTISNIYFDTDDFELIRNSLEKPKFKEKIRLRSYGMATAESPVYLELKRKAHDIVYKRRVQSTVPAAEAFLAGGSLGKDSQISREITYFRDFYRTLVPACLIIYDREAYYEPDGDLRLTVDFNPRYRTEQLNLTTSMAGRLLLPAGSAILEIKVQEALPLWLSRILTEEKIVKSSFSKYGAAYQLQQQKNAAAPAPAFAVPAGA